MPNGSLADRTVVISGGSRGIGLAIGIATAAVANMADGDKLARSSRSPEIMADAAVEIISPRPGNHRQLLHRRRRSALRRY